MNGIHSLARLLWDLRFWGIVDLGLGFWDFGVWGLRLWVALFYVNGCPYIDR